MSLNINTVLTLKNYMKVYILVGLGIYKTETVKEQWLCLVLCVAQSSWRQSFLPVRIRSSPSQISIPFYKKKQKQKNHKKPT